VQREYPDLSGILAAKAQRRRTLAALTWEEKVAIIEQMRRWLPKGQWKQKTTQEEPADPHKPLSQKEIASPLRGSQ